MMPHEGLTQPADRTEVRRVAILAAGQSPTRELYLDPRLKSASVPVHHWAMGTPCPCPAEGTFVIVVRYVDSGAVGWLKAHRRQLAGTALLLDDDIPGAITDSSLPWGYRLKLGRFWLRFRRSMLDLCDELWAAAPAVIERLAIAGFRGSSHLIDPIYCGPPLPRPALSSVGPVSVFYHGLPTHTAECMWLRDIIAEVQHRRSDVLFEIIGRTDVKQAFSDLPRVRIAHPMTYNAYKAYMALQRFDLGLAPLLDTVFNRSRSCTKAYDIAAVGAVGLYGRTPIYERVIRHGCNGLLLPMDAPSAWVDAICDLAADPELRLKMRAATTFGGYRTPETLRRLCGEGP